MKNADSKLWHLMPFFTTFLVDHTQALSQGAGMATTIQWSSPLTGEWCGSASF
jgi:hypothetical protein